MLRCFIFFTSLFFFNIASSNESIYYVDMDFIMNNSSAGKSIIKQLENKNKSYSASFKKNEIDLIITQTSKCFDKEDSLLREKQKHISISRNKYIEVINTDSLGNEYRYDKCHYNQLGIEKLSNDISNIIIKLNK